MPVLSAWSFTLEVPVLEDGLKFYRGAGLDTKREGAFARFFCPGETHASIELLGGGTRKRLHHVTLRASELEVIAGKVPKCGGQIVGSPPGFPTDGLWVLDPNGMLIHLIEHDREPAAGPGPAFEINAPGRVRRLRRSAIKPASAYSQVSPVRLGHVLLFTPDVGRSCSFLIDALGMGLSDRAQDVIAFCCARVDSDHHVVAFAKSAGIGFHHASFEVNDPDEVGRAGRALAMMSGRGEWGFGRHTIGSNFFHYVQDPWGSWFEYFSDIDYIDDYSLWKPTNYPMEDSLASWAPVLPHDFVHNYEKAEVSFSDAAGHESREMRPV